jgi:fluoroacetyl-CoA thioesterase
MRTIEIGATATMTHTVTSADCATNWGNDLPVLATPVLLWLGEIASMKVVDAALEADEMTVGYAHTAQHLAATPVGWDVVVEAKLTRFDGRLAYFDVVAHDERDIVFRGEHVRATVGRSRFVDRLGEKTAKGGVPV